MNWSQPKLILTNRDWSTITNLIDETATHASGGTYNMMAYYVKGSTRTVGRNSLYRNASTLANHYPDICGVHAELDLWRMCGKMMRGGTLYVAGRKAKNGSIMGTTKPCEYCAALLSQTRLNFVVFLDEGEFTKCRPKDLV